MSKAFTEIAAGLNDAIAHSKGERAGTIEHRPEAINVKFRDHESRIIGMTRGMSDDDSRQTIED